MAKYAQYHGVQYHTTATVLISTQAANWCYNMTENGYHDYLLEHK